MRGDGQAAWARVLWREAYMVRAEKRGAVWLEEGGVLGSSSTGLGMMRVQRGRRNKKENFGDW